MPIRVRRMRKLRDRTNLTEALKLIREAEYTIDSSAGSLGRPGAMKDTESAKGAVKRVLASGTKSRRLA